MVSSANRCGYRGLRFVVGPAILCASLSAWGDEQSDQKGSTGMFGLFGKKDVNVGTRVAEPVGATLQRRDAFPASRVATNSHFALEGWINTWSDIRYEQRHRRARDAGRIWLRTMSPIGRTEMPLPIAVARDQVVAETRRGGPMAYIGWDSAEMDNVRVVLASGDWQPRAPDGRPYMGPHA